MNTILNMPQEQAMEKIIQNREEQSRHEAKELHYSMSGKMANKIGNEKRKIIEEKHQKKEMEERERNSNDEILRLLGDTMLHLLPADDIYILV